MSVKYTSCKGTMLQILFSFNFMCVSILLVCRSVYHTCTVPEEARKRVLDPLGLELPMWMLGIKPWFSRRAANDLNLRTISLQPLIQM